MDHVQLTIMVFLRDDWKMDTEASCGGHEGFCRFIPEPHQELEKLLIVRSASGSYDPVQHADFLMKEWNREIVSKTSAKRTYYDTPLQFIVQGASEGVSS